jgi:uncharacterized protein YjbI with pentapeptide repeats
MEELAVLFLGALGLSSYLLSFSFSLKKSVSLVSKRNAAGSRTLLSFIAIYIETALLSSLIEYFFPLEWPPYAAFFIEFLVIVFAASYTLKASFDLSYWRGILAYFLWLLLSFVFGSLLAITLLAAMFETVFTFILFIALALAVWWMWKGPKTEISTGRNHLARLGDSERKFLAASVVALLFSTLVTHSMVVQVYCGPQTEEYDVEVETDFDWANSTVRSEIAWSTTIGANVTYQQEARSAGQAPIVEFSQGFLQGCLETAWGIVNIPGAIYGLHDFKAATTYLSLINDVTKLQSVMEPQPILLPQNSQFGPKVEGLYSVSTFAKDGDIANRLAGMGRKEFKVEVASNPDIISRAVDVEKYVDGVAWDSALTNYFTLNFPLAYETYQRVKADTGSEGEALWQAARIFGLTSPWLEIKEALGSGDIKGMGSGAAKLVFTLGSTFFMLRSAYYLAKGEGLLSAVSKTAYDLVMPGQMLYSILKAGLLKARSSIATIRDVGLKEALVTALDDLANRFRSTEYIEFKISDDESQFTGIPYDYVTYDGELEGKVIVISTIEEAYLKFLTYLKIKVGGEWIPALKDQRLAAKLIDRNWIRSFIDEIGNYQRLEEIGEGTAEIQGVKVEIESKHWGRDYYELTMWDTGVSFRIYEDNSISARYQGEFTKIDTEALTIKKVDVGTFLMRSYLEKDGFFDVLKPGQEVDLYGAKGTVRENGEKKSTGPYVAIEFETKEGGTVRTKRVQFSSRGLTVNDRSVIGIEIEDDEVYLVYQAGKKQPRTLISQPKTIPRKPTKWNDVKSLATDMDLSIIKKDPKLYETYKIVTQKLGTEIFTNAETFGKFLTNIVQADEATKFKAEYGLDTYNEIIEMGNTLFKSVVEKVCSKLGLTDVRVKIEAGVEPNEKGVDAVVLVKDAQGEYSITLFEVEFECTSESPRAFATQKSRLLTKLTMKGKGDVGILLCKDKFHVFINPEPKYKPLLQLKTIDSRKLPEFMEASSAFTLGLLTGWITGNNGEAIALVDDKNNSISIFKDSDLHLAITQGSSVFDSNLALTSVESSELENVNSAGSTIVGSIITYSNISAKILNSVVQDTQAVCSNIENCFISMCRVLNSTLVNVLDLVGSYIEDSYVAYSAGISNCTVKSSNLISVLNLSNTNIMGSNLTLVANVDSSRIERSDISYSANISRSEIINTKLVGSTVQGSRLTSCTAVDSNLRNVNATNSNLASTNVEDSNLINVNATNSKLTKVNVEYSNLEDVELKNVEVYGTNMKDVKVADKTVVYGRVINSNGDLDPVHRVGTPNYSGKEAKRIEQTNIEFHGETAPSSTGKTSSHGSTSSGTKTKSNVTTSSKTSSSSGQSQMTKTSNQTISKQSTSTTSQEEKPIKRGSNIWIN